MHSETCSVSVYKITHLASGRLYFGITVQRRVRDRWRQHISDARTQRTVGALHRAIAKYGEDAFHFEVVAVVSGRDEGARVERRLIEAYGSMVPAGFNLTSGGEMTLGFKFSDETKQRMSEIGKRRCAGRSPFPPKSREERSAIVKEYYRLNPKKPESVETRARKAAAAEAYWERRRQMAAEGVIERVGHAPHGMSAAARANVAAAIRATWRTRSRVVPLETREKQSAALKEAYASGRRMPTKAWLGRNHSEESKQKMCGPRQKGHVSSFKGRTHSDEAKQKMRGPRAPLSAETKAVLSQRRKERDAARRCAASGQPIPQHRPSLFGGAHAALP